MRVFNETKTEELKEFDLTLGHLEPDTLTIHHEAVEGVEEVGHYETIREYPNGGRDGEWVVDIAGVEGHPAYDEEEDILLYVPYTHKELDDIALKKELEECREWLSGHDYIGIKIATGRATVEDYAEEIAEMRRRAERINEIERKI